MTVDELLNHAMWLYTQGGKGRDLEYISRSESSSLGWFFWLKQVPGVYELELKETTQEPKQEKGYFYLRYYPGRDEEVLENFSVAEQVLRFDESVFDDSEITVDQEEHEICPCCATAQNHLEDDEHEGGCTCGHEHHDHEHHDHEHHHEPARAKGIPRMLKKFVMDKDLFVIGEVQVTTQSETDYEALVNTKEYLLEYAETGITIMQQGQPVEIVPKGGVDRNVPGRELSQRFMNFFGKQFLAALRTGKGINSHKEANWQFSVVEDALADGIKEVQLRYVYGKEVI